MRTSSHSGIIRAFQESDLEKIHKLHEQFYSEFGFPDFLNLLNAFIIEDDEGIIMAGGVENVGEAVLVTNKDRNRIKVGRALVEAQKVSMFTCQKFGIRELYAFVKDDMYAEHLIQHGFTDCPRALSIRVPNG